MINIVIIIIPKLWLQLSILLNHDDDEHQPNKNAMKIANIIHNMNMMMNFILN
jgi:hypothetical protein